MNVTISTDDLVRELRKRLEAKCVCSSRSILPDIERVYLELKAKADKPIPFSCIE